MQVLSHMTMSLMVLGSDSICEEGPGTGFLFLLTEETKIENVKQHTFFFLFVYLSTYLFIFLKYLIPGRCMNAVCLRCFNLLSFKTVELGMRSS